MKNVQIKGMNVELYDSIEDLPIMRFHKYNKMLLVDAGVGSDLSDLDRHIDNINNPFYYRRQSLVNKNFCLRCQRFKISSGCVKQPG